MRALSWSPRIKPKPRAGSVARVRAKAMEREAISNECWGLMVCCCIVVLVNRICGLIARSTKKPRLRRGALVWS
ncbi:MAG: hypothetical protein UY32_C0024G0009 [Candidatus Jorgensenbacteria bacterium GW2011_GWC1_48_8]|uniref:Uncharacterized protein n=1 Tax=Candidatus Jorgensenbacteria bacterium GW2011_GWC1_48_8 TaxID=1618666 RepID=A0A0G1UWB1_9BACT|nr:MAG: hypothetical protein UY32_C0024G0009 [Candidatus Jorgensenbacteria bacterium GW2011_GWC1_48_8]